MARRRPDRDDRDRPSAYDSLIDAERDALLQAGRRVGRNDLIRALRDAADLSPREARVAVDGYIAYRNGLIPSHRAGDDARTGWIDDLIDAERAAAARADRPVTPRTMLRAVRQASPHLSARETRSAVADYLDRRGGRTPRATGRAWRMVIYGAVGVVLAALVAAWWLLMLSP